MEQPTEIMEPRLWRRFGWTARVTRNEEEFGWAVEMTRDGDPEPALVGPWTMGRDKKNPKPLDQGAFTTLIKTATEVLARHEQAAKDALIKKGVVRLDSGDHIRAEFTIVPDEDDPHGHLRCFNDFTGELLREGRVGAGFKMNTVSIERFVRLGEV